MAERINSWLNESWGVSFFQKVSRYWLEKVLKKSGLSVGETANLCKVSPRTIRDWIREKFTISENSCIFLSKRFNIEIPQSAKLIDNYWYVSRGAKKGGLKSLELYGPPGTKEGRILGGLISQKRRRENPEKYRLLGCNIRKDFLPLRESAHFAEMAGIILGDGGITSYQLRVTLDKKTDIAYIPYVCKLSKIVFGETLVANNRNCDGGVDLSLSGINLVENLSKFGLHKGDKIRRQIDFPKWIWKKPIYKRLCVRGLVDTDGCVFVHNHIIKGVKYRNLRICFSSRSTPLLNSVSKVVSNEKIKHSVNLKYGAINIYDLKHIIKYSKVIGFSNPKHANKIKEHLLYNRKLVE